LPTWCAIPRHASTDLRRLAGSGHDTKRAEPCLALAQWKARPRSCPRLFSGGPSSPLIYPALLEMPPVEGKLRVNITETADGL
jgi:hypothetical protein